MNNDTPPAQGSSENEHIKHASNYLRGTIRQGLGDPITGGIAPSDQQLIKFHGSYQQDDRDVRLERQKQKLEPLHSFMVRVRMPGGVCTPSQYLVLDQLARDYGGASLRLTTRQTFQFHGIAKRNLRGTIQRLHKTLLDTIAACGDVNRNVMCNPNPSLSGLHSEVYALARRLSERLLPRTRAYHEIWLGDELAAGGEPSADEEPLYGRHYLPRKFKIAIAVPPENDVDVFANDLGFIAIAEQGKLLGFDVTVGGGMGMTHGDLATYPRTGDVIGFCAPDEVIAVAEAVISAQRDLGNRKERKLARLKYTIDRLGLPAFVAEIEGRLGRKLAPARPFAFSGNGDRYGWVESVGGTWHHTLFIESGRIRDEGELRLLTALREIARVHDGDLRMTGNQNLIIANVSTGAKRRIDELLERHGLVTGSKRSGLRLHALTCVALPTCGQAMAEAERAMPNLLDRLDPILAEAGIPGAPIVVRMTGCPNGCARPYLAEIALVGKNLGKYNLYLGGAADGSRLGKLYREAQTSDEIVAALSPLLHRYATLRTPGEHFGDFVIRAGIVKATQQGKDFHS
jgi:sulfite reductase (NADPH) hemoprotein beta-component